MASRATASRKPKDPAGANPADASKLAGLDRLRAQIDAINVEARAPAQPARESCSGDRASQAGRRRRDLSAGARARGARPGGRAQSGAADRRASAAHLRRDNFGLHARSNMRCASRTSAPSTPTRTRPRGCASARSVEFAPQPSIAAVFEALDTGARRFRRGAGREFHRGLGDADARPADRHAAGDHRRDAAADAPCPDVARGRRRGDTRASFPISSRSANAATIWRPTFRIAGWRRSPPTRSRRERAAGEPDAAAIASGAAAAPTGSA